MKVTIERANLLKALNHVHRVVERRNTIPILANVLLRAEGAELSLKATDLDMEIVDRVPAAVEQPGAATVPAHMLYDIVRKLPDGAEIALDTSTGTTMALKAGRARFALQMLPEADFPDLNAGDLPVRFTLPPPSSEAADRPDPVRHLHRGDALLSERHLLPCRRRGRQGAAPRRGDRRPPPRQGGDCRRRRAAPACPA